MNKILVWTPACVFDGRHVAMNRVQTLVKRRLQPHLPDVELVSALLVDWSHDDCRDDVEAMAGEFDIYHYGVPTEFGEKWGIRKVTDYAIALARDIGAGHVLRIIQDTFVDDSAVLAQRIQSALPESGDWIGAHVVHWPDDQGHGQFTTEMGLPFTSDIRWPHGELMFAPLVTWEKHYVTLPQRIHHHWDDIMMGLSLLYAGGRYLDWSTPCWSHRHDCDVEAATSTYRTHQVDAT